MTDQQAAAFGSWFRAELAARGWNRSEFARRTGWPTDPAGVLPQTIGRWARGEQCPDAEFAARIALTLGVPVDEVLVRAGRRPADHHHPEGSVRRRLIALIEVIPEEELDPLIDMLDGLRQRGRRLAAERRG